MMEDQRIYRVAINGFPYKSASELGVENDFDAYFATKQAIYSILYERDVLNMYRGSNTRGEKIVNAINNLVNIGRYGTQTFQSANIQISKVGGLQEESNYYSQTYRTTSAVQMSNYDIISTANMPTGAYIADVNGNARTSFAGGENFKVMIQKSYMNQEINIVISAMGKCRTYPVFYGQTTVAGTQNYLVTTDPYGDYVNMANLTVATNTGKIEITKLDSETNNPISNTTFQLKKEDGTVVANSTTNASGKAEFNNLYQGNYVLNEISANDKYLLNAQDTNISVKYNETKQISLTNEHKKGNLKVVKVDKDNHNVAIGGVVFDLYSNEFNRVVGTYTTNANGEITINKVRIGDYSLIEKSTNKWYNLASDTNVIVEWNTTNNATVENELKKGQIRVIKVDLDNNEVRLQGVEFKVINEDGKQVDTLITDENGEAVSKKLRIDKEYTLQESKTLSNYVLNEEIQKVILQENQITEKTFENEKIKGYIQVTKTSSEDNQYSKLEKGSLLENAVFEVFDEESNIVDTITTDKTGKAVTKELLKGKYTIKEINFPIYYILNTNTYNAEIVKDQGIVNVDITNENVVLDIEIQKNGFIETQSKDDIFYNFKNIKNNSNVPLDNFTWSDNLPTDAVRINRIYTGTWNEDLEYSAYYKTNKTEDYILFADKLNTQKIYELNFTELKLDEDEYVTDYEFRFGKVKIGFQEIESPILYCHIIDGLGNGYVFTNNTKVSGTYYEAYVEAKDKWTTITYFKEIRVLETLPRTR